MKRHEFDPTSFVLGLAFAALGLFFLLGDRTAADIGWKWMWPVPVVLLGLLFVISEPPFWLATLLFALFVLARLAHTFVVDSPFQKRSRSGVN